MENKDQFRDIRKYNPFTMKKKAYKIKATPIQIKKNRHFDAFLKGTILLLKFLDPITEESVKDPFDKADQGAPSKSFTDEPETQTDFYKAKDGEITPKGDNVDMTKKENTQTATGILGNLGKMMLSVNVVAVTSFNDDSNVQRLKNFEDSEKKNRISLNYGKKLGLLDNGKVFIVKID